MRNKEYKKRIDSLLIRIKENEMTKKDKFIDTFHLAKFLLIHSFSHLIIKELEFYVVILRLLLMKEYIVIKIK